MSLAEVRRHLLSKPITCQELEVGRRSMWDVGGKLYFDYTVFEIFRRYAQKAVGKEHLLF